MLYSWDCPRSKAATGRLVVSAPVLDDECGSPFLAWLRDARAASAPAERPVHATEHPCDKPAAAELPFPAHASADARWAITSGCPEEPLEMNECISGDTVKKLDFDTADEEDLIAVHRTDGTPATEEIAAAKSLKGRLAKLLHRKSPPAAQQSGDQGAKPSSSKAKRAVRAAAARAKALLAKAGSAARRGAVRAGWEVRDALESAVIVFLIRNSCMDCQDDPRLHRPYRVYN